MGSPTVVIDPATGERVNSSNIQIDPATGERLSASGGGTGTTAQPGFLSTLGDLGAGVVKGVTQSVTALPALAGNALNSALGYQKPQRVTDEENYLTPTDTAQKIGKYGEQAAEFLVPAAAGAHAAYTALPTTAKAGALFNEVADAANSVPVALQHTQPALERVAQLTDAGGPTLGAPNKLLLRSQTVNPISYQEARDFYTNISSLSAQDKMALNGPMRKAVGDLASAFKQDIGDTAASVGKGDQYAQAMKQYAQAKQIQDAVTKAGSVAAKYAIPAAGGALLYPALRYLMDLAK